MTQRKIKLIILLIAFLPSFGELNGQIEIEMEGKLRVNEMDTTMTGGVNVVRLDDGTLAIRKYSLGDFAHGGIIFWLDNNEEHGLIVDTADASNNLRWYNNQNKITNANGDGIYSGNLNTALSISQQTIDNPFGNFAALTCSKLVRGDYGDWYLPSKRELNELHLNRAMIDSASLVNGGKAFENDIYWSSTEFSESQANIQIFPGGFQGQGDKSNLNRVRAIRRF